MRRRATFFVCLLAVVLASLALPAYSQEISTGTITGTVTDEKGKPAADVVITARSPQGARKAISDKNGYFIIPFLTPGTYAVQVVGAGFSTIVQDDIIVRMNVKTAVKYALQPGKVETITVTGQAPLLDRATTSTGTNVKVADFTADIPVGRNYSQLFTTSPGVVSGGGTGSGNYSIGGASGLENSYIIDGVNVTNTGYGGIGSYNIVYGSLGTGVTGDFLDEVQVKTGGFEAEFGQALGGVLNAVVKSGTNEFRGGLGFYSTLSALEGSRERVRTELGTVNTREEDIYDFAFSYGGPLIKDKLFWFVAINPVETRTRFEAPSVIFPYCDECSIDISDISGTQAYPASGLGLQERTRRSYNYAGKLTWFMASNHRLDFSIFGDPSRGFNGPQQDTSLLFYDYASGGGQSGIRYGANNGTIKYNGIITPKFFIDAQISRHDGRFSENEMIDGYRIRDRRAQLLFNYGELPVGPANFTGGTGFISQQDDISTQYSVKLTNVLPGGHEVKYGVELTDIEYLDDQAYSGPATEVYFAKSCTVSGLPCRSPTDCDPAIYPGDACGSVYDQVPLLTTSGATLDRRADTVIDYDGDGDVDDPVSVYRMVRNRYYPTPPATTAEDLSFFAQDTWQINPRWTLKAGVRATREKISGSGSYTLPIDFTVSNRVGTTSYKPSSYTFDWVFSPRLGVTYDVLGTGKSKLYANYARYYQRVPNDLAVRSFSSETGSTSVNYAIPVGVDPVPTIPWHLQALQTGGPNFQGFPNTRIQEGTKLPYEDEYILGYQQQLRPDLSVEIRGIFRYQGRVLEDVQFTPLEATQNYYYGTNYGYPYDPFPAFGIAPFGEYVLANPDENTPASAGFPDPKRDYKAVEFSVNKTFSNNWAMTANYRYSQLKGNYEGLYRNDNGQSDPNITSLFDFPNSPLMEGQFFSGFLNTDRTHVLNLYPYRRWANGFTIGAGFNWQSGTPRQPLLAHPSYQNGGEIPGLDPVYAWWTDTGGPDLELATGTAEEWRSDPGGVSYLFLYDYKKIQRGYLGRTPDIMTMDLNFSYPIKFSDDSQLNVMLSIFNVFNNQQARGYDDFVESIAGISNPDYLTPSDYGAPRTMRLAVNWSF